ncbi:MAG: pyridoxal phosphate-dependent aminotransferase [Deltaproteobacteria bacterium]|nr:pyridoxal phosphate-dependent aminotransferase [Deltaproteobacteria bacterium]
MGVSKRIQAALAGSSWIRRMFEEGAELKARLGPEQVSDFTLGNPDLEPPPEFKEELRALAQDPRLGLHSYMPNAGLPEVRQALARHLSQLHHLDFQADDVILTCGAAGALNVILKAILDPKDEVVVFAPYFPEYLFYADNHGGVAKVVETDKSFQLDLNRLEAALTPRTRAVLLNSPNNPTGQIYGAETLKELGRLLTHHWERHGRPVYLVGDEPYRRIVFNGVSLPSLFAAYSHTILATSFSKDLSIPGERLGYAAVSPRTPGREEVVAGMILANRILGFVNAPALAQRVVAKLTAVSVDVRRYAQRRDLMARVLTDAGYNFVMPRGAFYFFPQAPGGDDLSLVARLKEENILGVPGRGFGRAGYFRLAFCVPEASIERAAPGFARVRKALG